MKKSVFGFIVLSSFFISCNKKQATIEEEIRYNMVKDSLDLYHKLYKEAAYFSIDQNENAQNEFSPNAVENVMAKVVQDFTVLNQQEGGNPLLPQNSGSISKVNRMSVINHKWLIIDFYNDSFAGELLIRYDFVPNETTAFTVIDTVIY